MIWEKWVSRYLLVQFRFFTRKYKWAKRTLLKCVFLSLLYLAQAKPAAVFESKPPGLNSDWQCTPYCGVSGVRTESIGKQEHKCLCSSPTSMIMQNLLLSKNSTAVQECLAGTAGLGGSICCCRLQMFCPKQHLFFFPGVSHKRELCSIIHTSAVVEELALSTTHFWPLDVQAAPSHSCHTTVSWISWTTILGYFRQFYFFLFCIGKKKKAIRRDRKQQFDLWNIASSEILK